MQVDLSFLVNSRSSEDKSIMVSNSKSKRTKSKSRSEMKKDDQQRKGLVDFLKRFIPFGGSGQKKPTDEEKNATLRASFKDKDGEVYEFYGIPSGQKENEGEIYV